MQAHCLIRDQPWYRRDVFVNGLRRAGHTVTTSVPSKPDKDTLLVIWNRYADNHHIAQRVEDADGTVIVAENGYIGAGGGTPKFQVHPKGPQPGHYYALARGWHNGGGTWPVGAEDRWGRLGIELRPWRDGGDYILVCPNRSFGVPGRMMPEQWAEKIAARLREVSTFPVRIRRHPGNDAPKHSLDEDLKGAAMVVVWTSSCGVHALVEGIPVICEAPYWICKSAAVSLNTAISEPLEEPDRLKALRSLAYAQWTCEEIASGEPFRFLLPQSR